MNSEAQPHPGFDLFLFFWFSPGLKYQRCNAPTNKRNSSHHCHSPPSSSSGLDFVQKRGFKKKKNIYHNSDYEAAASILIIFQRKRFQKKTQMTTRNISTFPPDIMWVSHWLLLNEKMKEDLKVREEGAKDVDGNGMWSWRKTSGEPELVFLHLEEAPRFCHRAGLKVSEGCFREAAEAWERRRENDPERRRETSKQLTLKDFKSIWFTVFPVFKTRTDIL